MGRQFHIADLFEITAEAVPERVALVSDARAVTYAELNQRADALAAALSAGGLKRGDHVGLYLNNCPEYMEAFLGLMKLGAVPFNVNYRYQAEELVYLFDNADAVGVVHGASYSPEVDEIQARLPKLTLRVAVDDQADGDARDDDAGDDAKDVAKSLSFEKLIQEGEAILKQQPSVFERSEDDYLMLYTGGTTGMPKGVMWPHKAFFFACLGGGGLFHPSGAALVPEDMTDRATGGYQLRMLTIAPLMHGAAIWSAWACLLGGLTLVLDTSRSFNPESIWSLVERHGVNIVQIVGDAMAIPLRDALRANPDRWNLQRVFNFGSGGAVFSGHVKEDIKALLPNVVITDGMGSSETGIAGMAEPSEDGMMRLDASANQQVIVDDHIGAVGELGMVGRAGNIPLGYYKDPVKTAEAFRVVEGVRWSITGDAGRLDEDGKITLFGRGSTCINTGGEKVYPEEVEEILREHPEVFDAVVTSVPDERWGQRVVAIVSARSAGTRVDEEAMKAFLAQRMAGYKLPRALLWVDQVPRSPAGKQDYRWAKAHATAELGA